MKRLFSNLKAIVAVVVMTAVMGAAVSCNKAYDDTTITNRVNQLEKDLAALKERVAALETKVATDIEALNALINGMIFVTDVKTVDGDTVVYLSDETTITIPAEEANEYVDTDTDTFLSVREDAGVYYWAFFNKDGFVDWLLVDGEKVAVYNESEGCACELKFSVDTNTGNLLVSIDGGLTWVDSGICMNSDDNGNTNVGACIFTGVSVDEENGTVTFTTADGQFTVALAEVIEFNVKDTLYVAAGEKKSVTFEAGEAVSDVYVMNQPMGWRAAVEGNTLIVTAPAAEVVAMGIAEKTGTIALHLNTASGACKVAKLDVAFAELTLTIDKQGNFLIENTLVTTFMRQDPETYESYEVTDFLPWYFAVLPLDSYTGAPEDWYYGAIGTFNDNMNWYGANYDGAVYEEGVVEKSICTGSLEDFLYEMTYGQVLFEGESFAVAVMPLNTNSYEPEAEKAVVVEFIQKNIKATCVDATWNNAYFDVTLRGADSYQLLYVDKADLANYMEPAEYYAEKLEYLDYGMSFGMGAITENFVDHYVALYDLINYGADYPQDCDLTAGHTYELAILPMEEGKTKGYTYEDLVITEFKLEDIAPAAEPLEVTFGGAVDYTSIKPVVSVPENTAIVYYAWQDTEVAEGTDEYNALFESLNGTYYNVNDFEEYGYDIEHTPERYLSGWNQSSLTPGKTKVLALLVIDTDGQYSLLQHAYTTKQVVVNTDYTMGVGELSISGGVLSVPVTGIDGAEVAKYRYYLVDTGYYSLKSNDSITSEIAISTHSHYIEITGDAITNPLSITKGLKGYSYKELAAGTTYKFALVAVFADDTVSNVVIVDEVVYDMDLVKSTDAAWAATKPTFTISSCIYEPDDEMFDVYYSFELPEGVTEVYASIMDPEYLQNQVGRSAKISYLVESCTEDIDEDGILNNYVRDNYKLYFTWKDSEGKMYEVAEVDLTEYYEAAKNPGTGDDEGGSELEADINKYGFSKVRVNIMSAYAQLAFDGGALQNFQIEVNHADYTSEEFKLVPGTYTYDHENGNNSYADFTISYGALTTFVEGTQPTDITLTINDAGDGKYQFDVTLTAFGQTISDRFTLPISAWS